MTIYYNEELGVSLQINEDSSAILKSTKPRTESMMADDRVHAWTEATYNEHFSQLQSDYTI